MLPQKKPALGRIERAVQHVCCRRLAESLRLCMSLHVRLGSEVCGSGIRRDDIQTDADTHHWLSKTGAHCPPRHAAIARGSVYGSRASGRLMVAAVLLLLLLLLLPSPPLPIGLIPRTTLERDSTTNTLCQCIPVVTLHAISAALEEVLQGVCYRRWQCSLLTHQLLHEMV